MERGNRPVIIQSLCWLSFIGNTIGFITFIIGALYFKKAAAWITKMTNITVMDGINPFFFLCLSGLFLISLVGVSKIWKMSVFGLLIYIPARILLLFLPVIWFDWQAFSMTNAVFTFLFIVLYLTQIRKFKFH